MSGEGVPCFPQGRGLRGQGPHLLPDGVVAEEAAHLALGQRAARVGVLVAREQVHAEGPHDTAVEHPEGHSVTGSGVPIRDPRRAACTGQIGGRHTEVWFKGGGGGGGLVAKLCTTLGDPVDCNLPGSSVHRISQARKLEWLPFPSPGHLPDQELNPRLLRCKRSPVLQADSLLLNYQGFPVEREEA